MKILILQENFPNDRCGLQSNHFHLYLHSIWRLVFAIANFLLLMFVDNTKVFFSVCFQIQYTSILNLSIQGFYPTLNFSFPFIQPHFGRFSWTSQFSYTIIITVIHEDFLSFESQYISVQHYFLERILPTPIFSPHHRCIRGCLPTHPFWADTLLSRYHLGRHPPPLGRHLPIQPPLYTTHALFASMPHPTSIPPPLHEHTDACENITFL